MLCLRLLGHDRLEATNFGLGAAGNDTRSGPGNARIGPRTAAIGLAFCVVSGYFCGRLTARRECAVLAVARTRSSGNNQFGLERWK